MTAREVLLDGGSPWGFRMNGGADVGHALRISRVNPGSKAAQKGVREGDVISSINGQPTKCLTNGESHALLRTVGETLRLGLNQDANGSPKRRSKEPVKRETSSSSTHSTPSTPILGDPAPAPTTSEATSPSDQSEPTSAGAKVFVCGLWNSVNKTKERGKKGTKTEAQVKSAENPLQRVTESPVQDPVPKTSSSKARRLRKLKLKNGKREEQATPDHESEETFGIERNTQDRRDEDDNIELVVVMEEEDICKVEADVSRNEGSPSESASVVKETTTTAVVEQKDNTSKTTKSKTKKKNGKNKGFSLSQIFTSKNEKITSSDDVKMEFKDSTSITTEQVCDRNQTKEMVLNEKSIRIIPAALAEATGEIVKEILAESSMEANENSDQQSQSNISSNESSNILPEITIKEPPILNPSTTFTINTIDRETILGPSKTEMDTEYIKSASSVLKDCKTIAICSSETTNEPKQGDNNITNKEVLKDLKAIEDEVLSVDLKNIDNNQSIKRNETDETTKITIFVVPPNNVATEAEAPGVNWESVSNFESKSQNTSSGNDEVLPETLVHLPSNDLQASTIMKEGRNGIVQIDDYDLSVQDLYSPFMAPEEEARLRSFLETLNLTKPEEYDDTSSSKSFGDSSSTSISESSPIPPPSIDEIVVYRHVKSHSVAEPCYIPPRHHRHLDVITEESSDPSDSERRQGSVRPWENSEMIRENNDIEKIPNDWYGSEEEPETTSDEGGIDLSWRDGRKLDDVEGVEVVYLSDDSEVEISVNNGENVRILDKNENLPELVVVHTIDREDVKSTVKLRHPKGIKHSEDEVKHKKNAMDEIVAILDSTYEINKDLFMKHSSNDANIKPSPKKMNESSSRRTENLKTNQQQKTKPPVKIMTNTVDNDKAASSIVKGVLQLEKYDSLTAPNEDKTNEDSSDELPLAQESLVAMTPPTLSRQGSSSSATSQSTAKYNPGQSPMSSETEDKAEIESNRKRKTKKKLYNPKSLICLSKEVVTCLPHGEFYLKKIGFWNADVSENEANYSNTETSMNGKLTSLPPSGITTRRSSYYELEHIYSQPIRNGHEKEVSPPRPVLLKSPPPSSLISPSPNSDPWIGLPTSADSRLLICLSPSQSKENTITSTKEATELLELHKKFVERRGYHESNKRNSIYSPKSERSRTPDFNSPDLIRLEPYEAKEAQVYTPELLIEAANLLALKEYRQSRFKSGQQLNTSETSDLTVNTVINSDNLEKPDGLSEMTSPRTEIGADSEGPDSNRSAGTSRLLALLQDSGVPCSSPNNTVPLEMDRVDKSGPEADRVRRYTGSYISEWLTMTENVSSSADIISNTDFNKNVVDSKECVDNRVPSLDNVNEERHKDRRQFDADKYKISKQGDIAIIQSTEESGRQHAVRGERPKSLPSAGVPALTPSGGELFREQMYHEYMNKVAERTERRQQKVIKISSRPLSAHSKPEIQQKEEVQQNPSVNQLESEFMIKARERMTKLGINLDEEQSSETTEETKTEELPRHLQEFIELTTAPLADAAQDAPTGVWSPGATPEPQRKQFNFSAAKEEEPQPPEDQEPQPAVWTPKSAQASPTTERKTFRPVNFESPKPSRKATSQKSAEDAPKPPTDLPLSLDSPSHSHSSSVSSSTQYLSSRETVTTQSLSQSQSQETSGRLVTSHSLPDTSLDNKLPRAQNPTITLLQKAREGQLPRGAHYLEQNTSEKRSSPPTVRPNEVLYSIRKEYDIETEDKQPKKIVDLSPRKYDGIGPTTREGIPIVLRSEVQDENQQKWYKRMYDSLHRAERDKEYVTVRYKTRRGRYPYTSSAGYLSEPEPLGGYDSDYATAKYATLDRRRIRNKENDFTTSTMPRSKYNAVKHGVDVYKNQPGRIEDYEPGHSSIADKETKQWWDEVMDIFDGQFEQTQKTSPRTHAPTTTSTNKPFMTYALKESGYESDSTLVFKRRDETQQQLSPAEQKLAYKTIQKGGDVPLHGLRKPVPEKPKEPIRGRVAVPQRGSYPPQRRPESPHRYVESEVTIHYRSPVRSEEKEAWSEEELQRRQAEAMRRIYQEERRRKYLQELQDMYSRRHTDNFTPSQKSPIPLNRYDDFVDDLSPSKPRDRTPEPKLVARALYNFIGQTSRELTFRRGDIIYVRRQIDKNWYEGEHNAMIGLFPFNYVEIIPYDGIRTIPKRPTEGQARAKFNFQAQTHLELPLVKGELVLLTRRVDNNWFEGRIGTRKGIFPVSYVEVLVEPGERALSPVRVNTPTKPVASPAAHSLHVSNNMSQHHYQPPRPVSYTSLPRQKTADLKQPPVNQTLHIDTQNEPVPYRVLYNYKPQNEDELELIEGETVYVMEKCDDGWYVGSSQRTGYLGTFPGNYVERQV